MEYLHGIHGGEILWDLSEIVEAFGVWLGLLSVLRRLGRKNYALRGHKA